MKTNRQDRTGFPYRKEVVVSSAAQGNLQLCGFHVGPTWAMVNLSTYSVLMSQEFVCRKCIVKLEEPILVPSLKDISEMTPQLPSCLLPEKNA